MPDARPLEGKVALVTGAARGIGRAVAVALADAGARLVAGLDITGRVSSIQEYDAATEAELAETGRLVRQGRADFVAITCDQRDSAAVKREIGAFAQAAGRIDILAAVAGIQAFKPLLEMNDADWQDQIDVNLTGTANVIRAVAPFMVSQGDGRIIVTSSTQGEHGMRDGASYSASKWGLFGLMKSAALEFGPHGITVNAVVPGLIDTDMTRNQARYAQAIKESQGKAPKGKPEFEIEQKVAQAQSRKIPLGVAFLPPEDIAGAYVYLASPAARMVTGTSIAVTGGDSAHNLA